jgi:hypothetical protein
MDMATPTISDVVADPVGVVVEFVAGIEPGLDRAVLAETVARVAGGRAKRRRLAQALADRPGVLGDGRSPAPRVVGDLLVALRHAGAKAVSPPRCAGCGKHLWSFYRRGQDWYCGGCGNPRASCASCGKDRFIVSRDRHGRPRCERCPDRDERDPLSILTQVITRLDPSLTTETINAAARRVFSQHIHLLRLAWAIEDNPTLLTGAGAHAPLAGVLRLIDELRKAGTQTITRPACPGCRRIIGLHRRINGQWHCRNCVAQSRAQPCSRCGALREPAIRDEHGRPLCPYCLITDPTNQETCRSCGRRRPVSVRTPQGPLCPTCRPSKTMSCAICARQAPCVISKTTGQPWCYACQGRWARCSRCGDTGPIYGGTRAEPLCSTCTRPDPEFWRACPSCGHTGRVHRCGPCARCALDQRLRDLLGDETGQIPPLLQPLHRDLLTAEYPATVLDWLGKNTTASLLRELATGSRPLTHTTLDEFGDSKPLRHLRSVLAATGALPARDEHLARLEHWITRTIAQRPDPEQQQLLHRYAVWHVLRRLRRRLGDTHASYHQVAGAQQHVKAAITLFDWLTTHSLTLATATQGDLDAWLLDEDTSHHDAAGNFVRWAKKQKLTRLDFPAVKWAGPSSMIDTETRWDQARWLLHDDTVKPEDRVTGLLVLLYAQWPATISRLTLDHIDITENDVRLRLGREPVVLPEPLATLVRQVLATRHGHASIGDHGTSPWLFPGGQPGRPISAYRLGERLHQLGIRPGQARSTTLFQLATELPAALLARMLGIHINVAIAWQRASSGDWTNYAATISHRNEPSRQEFGQF